MQNMVTRHLVVAPSWGRRAADRGRLHGSTYLAFALIALAIVLTFAAAAFPDFFAGDVGQFGPCMP